MSCHVCKDEKATLQCERCNVFQTCQSLQCQRSFAASRICGLVDNKTISGAGVILIENYTKGYNKKRGPAVILFRNRKTKRYGDGGGGRDNGEDIHDTARRELKEESCGLFRLTRKLIATSPYADHGSYIGFFVPIFSKNGIQSTQYRKNMDELKRVKASDEWQETDDMKRIFVLDLDLNTLNKRGNVDLREANSGNMITVEGKTKALLRIALQKGIFDQQRQYVELFVGGGERRIPNANLKSYYNK